MNKKYILILQPMTYQILRCIILMLREFYDTGLTFENYGMSLDKKNHNVRKTFLLGAVLLFQF